jgi:hypothetical protein
VDVFSGGRVDAGAFATRINTAANLLAAGMPTMEIVRDLAGRFGVSTRQARRYVDHAKATGSVAVPEQTVVFCVKLPVSLTTEVRSRAHRTQTTISGLVAEALTGYLAPDLQESART